VFYNRGAGLDPDLPRIFDAEREYRHAVDRDRLVDATSGAEIEALDDAGVVHLCD